MRGLIIALALLFGGSAIAQDFTLLYPDGQAMRKARKAARDARFDDAHEYYLTAAQYGNKEAQKLIGLQYLEGQGVDADAALAMAWLQLANTMGEDLRVKKAMAELDSVLDEDAHEQVEKHYKKLAKDYGDDKALKKRKLWARKELRSSASGARRPNRVEQTQVQIDGMYYRVSMGEYMDALDAYADDFEEKIKAAG